MAVQCIQQKCVTTSNIRESAHSISCLVVQRSRDGRISDNRKITFASISNVRKHYI